MFPRTLDTTSLAGLLGAPLACRVPLPQSQYQHANRLFPDLFCPETTISAHDLHPFLITALQASWPTGSPTELLLTSFWDTVGYKLPEFAAGHLGIAVSENRSVGVSLQVGCPSCNCPIEVQFSIWGAQFGCNCPIGVPFGVQLSNWGVHLAIEPWILCGLPHVSLGCLQTGSVQEFCG